MILNVYSVFDKVAEESGPPFTAVNDGIAKRSYNQMGIPVALQNDYSLHRIRTYDTVTMEIVPEIIYSITQEADNE